MPLWSLTNPPVWKSNAVATPAGWEDPDTGELIVTIEGLSTTKTHTAVTSITLDLSNYGLEDGGWVTSEVITIYVTFNAAVLVTGVPTIAATFGGNAGNFSYVSGSGVTGDLGVLTFQHTVASNDNDGLIVLSSPIVLNGGTIKEHTSLSNATLTFSGGVVDAAFSNSYYIND